MSLSISTFAKDRLVQALGQRLDQLSGALRLQLPDGQILGPSDANVVVQLHGWNALPDLVGGNIGAVGEAIVEGRMGWQGTARDLMQVAARLLKADPTTPQHRVQWLNDFMARWRSAQAHSKQRDAAQIQAHYDVSDDFYKLWLDEKRVYSCAYFRLPEMNLGQAQEAKLEHICRKLQLQPGHKFLDIGAGWGGLLFWAAEHYGVDATGITLSKNQHAYISAEIERRGLGDRVRVMLMDYRDLDQPQGFDRIASVGMFEHVGRANMVRYFTQVRNLLRPGGLLMNHGITSASSGIRQLGSGMGDFIEKYIFPGGELLHVSVVADDLSQAGLELVDLESLRPHYAKTLWAWSDNLEAQLDAARAVLQRSGGERAENILQAYRLYLAGSAVGFERNWISLYQMVIANPTGVVEASSDLRGRQSAYPFRRDYMYSLSSQAPAPAA